MTTSKHNRFTTHTHKNDVTHTTAIILAASAGRRMIGYGLRNLLPYQNKLVVDYQINSIRSVYPDCSIIVVGGFQHAQLYEHLTPYQNVTLLYNPSFKESMNTLSLYMALLTVSYGNVLFMNGDMVFSPTAIPNSGKTEFTVDTRNKMAVDEVGISWCNGSVVNLAFGLTHKWGQIGYVSHTDVQALLRACSKYENPLFSCLNTFCNSVAVGLHENPKSVLFEIDSIKDYNENTN